MQSLSIKRLNRTTLFHVTINGTWGCHPSPLIVKDHYKTENTNNMILLSIIKIFLDNFYNNFLNFISSAGLSRDHYFRGAIHEIHDFRVFLRISQWVFDISYLIVRSYRVLVINIKFDHGWSSYFGNKAQSPDFASFLTIVGIFGAVCFGTS